MTLPKNVDDLYPLSPMQHLMLLHAIAEDGNGVLLNQVCYDIHGALDVDAFRRAWELLLARHDALRTGFLWEGLPHPVQVVRTVVPLNFRTSDVSALSPTAAAAAIDALRREDATSPMVLGKAPLMRCMLVRLGASRHHFIWSIHHLIVDRWSHAVIFRDLGSTYESLTRGELPTLAPTARFREYVDWIARQDRAAAERFWRDELGGVRDTTCSGVPATAPGERERVTTQGTLSVEETAALRVRAGRWRITPGALLQFAIGILLSQQTVAEDVVFGLAVAGRPPDLPEACDAVGSFVSNVAVRFRVQRDRSIEACVLDIHRAEGRRQPFVHVSPADILHWTGLPPDRPLFDTLVLLNLSDEPDPSVVGLRFVNTSATLDAGYPLVLAVGVRDNRFFMTLLHNDDVDPRQFLLDLGGILRRLGTMEDDASVGNLLPEIPGRAIGVGAAAQVVDEDAAAISPTSIAPTEHSSKSLESELLEAWRQVLGHRDLGLDDDFFAMGGTSLQAAQLFARVDRIVGRSLPLSTLFGAGSVRGLLAELGRPLPRRGSLVPIRSLGSLPPLYAVPGIGGSVVGFAGLARQLGPEQPFGAFESPGLDGREPPLTSIEAIAERYVDELKPNVAGPYHLLGTCWGAAVVIDMARRLHDLGRAPTSVVLLDPAILLRDTTARPAHVESRFVRERLELYWDEFRQGNWAERSRMLASKAKRAARTLTRGEAHGQNRAELQQLRVRAANELAVTSFIPKRFAGRAILFITTDRVVHTERDPRLEWLSLIEPTPNVASVVGNNSGDVLGPTRVGGFARALREWMAFAATQTS